MQLYWHTTKPSYAALRDHSGKSGLCIARTGRCVRPQFPSILARTRSYRTTRGLRVWKSAGQAIPTDASESSSVFGKMTVFVTDGHLPYPYGRELTGYEVSNLKDTLAKATDAGVKSLSSHLPRISGMRHWYSFLEAMWLKYTRRRNEFQLLRMGGSVALGVTGHAKIWTVPDELASRTHSERHGGHLSAREFTFGVRRRCAQASRHQDQSLAGRLVGSCESRASDGMVRSDQIHSYPARRSAQLRLFRDDAPRALRKSQCAELRRRRHQARQLSYPAAPISCRFPLRRTWQFFVQVEDDRAFSKNVITPVDQDPLDLRLGFLAYVNMTDAGTFKARAGRQDFDFDLQRFVSSRDGPNVRQSFDAVWGDWESGPWRFIGFFSQPVQYSLVSPFDDTSNSHFRFHTLRIERQVLGTNELSAVLFVLSEGQRSLTRCQPATKSGMCSMFDLQGTSIMSIGISKRWARLA